MNLCALLLSALAVLGAQAAPAELVTGKVRVQVLAPTLVRLEVRGPRGFEDRPTFHILQRDWPGAEVRRDSRGGRLLLAGAAWTLELPEGTTDLKGIRVLDRDGGVLWSGAGNTGNNVWLPGPAEHPRILAVADTPRLVPPAWGLAPAPSALPDSGWDLGNDAADIYLFLPGGDYATLRRDFLRLTGPTELPPLYAFGLFRSRYWPDSAEDLLGLVARYRQRGFPLDVLVVDTDWRVGASTGYGENKTLFPDMPGFLAKVHDAGVKVMFNDHPEPQAATALDPNELAFRAEGLGRWLRAGLDLWWFDRNWSSELVEPLPGLRKETWGMRLYHDLTARAAPERRPLIMANVDGIDNGHRSEPPDMAAHRFPIQWTGDTLSEWAWLEHAVDNALYEGVHGLTPYIGEDLTGHMGVPSVELYARFLEFGALSPTMRLHSSNSPAYLRDPWSFGPGAEAIARDWTRLRYRLLPLLYAGARRNYDTGEPLLRRLDLLWPGHREAARGDQYLLGDGLLVAPVITGEASNPTVPQSLLTAGDGRPGLDAAYYPNPDATGPATRRLEPVLEFSRNRGSAPLPTGPMSAVWTATFRPDRPVQLGLVTEAEASLSLDGREILAHKAGGPWATVLDPALTLVPGRAYALRVSLRGDAKEPRIRLFMRTMDCPGPRTRTVWLPPGTWIDAWTGARLQGPATVTATAALAQVPLYVLAGTILPLAPDAPRNSAAPWDPLALDVYPGTKSSTGLYEDDGAGEGYKAGACRRTELAQELAGDGRTLAVTLGAAAGSFPGAPAARAWTLRVHRAPGAAAPRAVSVDGSPCTAWTVLARGAAAMPLQAQGPVPDGDVLEIRLPSAPVAQGRRVEIAF